MNWIFSFRIKFVGLKVILGVMSVVGGGGAVLDILDGHWEVSGRSGSLLPLTSVDVKTRTIFLIS